MKRRGAIIGNSPGGNYSSAVEVLASQVRAGDAVHVEIRHDDWCAIWKRKPCDCDPDIEARTLGGRR